MISFDPHKHAAEVDIIPILQMRKLRPRDKKTQQAWRVYLGETKSVTQIYRLKISSIQSLMQQILPEYLQCTQC